VHGDKTRYEPPTCPRCGCFEGTVTEEPITPRTVDENGHADFGRPASHFKNQQQEPPSEPTAAQTPPQPHPTAPAPAIAPNAPQAAPATPEVVVKYDIGIDVKSVTGIEPGKAYFVEITKNKTPEQFKAITSNLINLGLAIGVKFVVIPEGSVVSIRGVQK
jgi:hypothetical protein